MLKQIRSKQQSLGLMIVLMASWQIGQPLQAATFYWDADESTVGNSICWNESRRHGRLGHHDDPTGGMAPQSQIKSGQTPMPTKPFFRAHFHPWEFLLPTPSL
jgi:hypothetical protein